MGFSKFNFISEKSRLLEAEQTEQREQEQYFEMSLNKKKHCGTCSAKSICKYEHGPLQDKIVTDATR